MLLALLLYSYAVGQRSSRRVESLCVSDVAFRVVCAQDVPDHTTIARFRAVHEEAFADLFTQVLVMCARAGMGRVGVVSIDGTKIAANASRGANRTEETLRAEANRILGEAAAVDAAEDEEFGDARGDELPPVFADRGGRGARIRKALEEVDRQRTRAEELTEAERVHAEEYVRSLEAGAAPRHREAADSQQRGTAAEDIRRAERALEDAEAPAARSGEDGDSTVTVHTQRVLNKTVQANTTDPDSKLMTTSNNGSIQGFNAQIAVSDDHLILAAEVTQDANDYASFEPMMNAAAAAAERVLAAQPPTGDHDEERPTGVAMILADAGYFSEHNLTVEGPDRLIALGKARQLHRGAREHPTSGPPHGDATPIEAMRHRLRTPEGAQAYKRRGATVEPINAHLKDQVGLRRFSRRGLKAVSSELDLAAAVVNLLKLHRRTTPAVA